MPHPYQKAPFPYFGGKTDAAPFIWDALGDVDHYVEPFCGSLSVLLLRPHPANRTYASETVNDLDGLLVNMWRAMQFDPDGLAEVVSWPVTEVDLTARHLAIVRWRAERDVERLLADPEWYDVRIAGYWLYGICAWIGSDWCSGKGPWIVGADGRITRRATPPTNDDRDAGAEEPGVMWKRPHLSNNGHGVHRPQLREPGVSRRRPHLTDNGNGVHRSQLREPGVMDGAGDWHPLVMPKLREWFRFLSARLRHVRITCGDWKRVVTDSACKTLPVRTDRGVAGVFLDPPYAGSERASNLYIRDSGDVSREVREWCLEHGNDPALRIVLAGYAGEGHEILEQHGWQSVAWFKQGLLKGGYGKQSEEGHQQHRERLWLSPHCLRRAQTLSLWEDG